MEDAPEDPTDSRLPGQPLDVPLSSKSSPPDASRPGSSVGESKGSHPSYLVALTGVAMRRTKSINMNWIFCNWNVAILDDFMEKHLRQRAQVAKHASRDWGKWWKWVPDLYNRRWKKLAKQCSLIGVFYHWVPSDAHDAESVLVRIATEISSVLAFLLSLFFMFHHVSSTWQLRYKRAVSPKDLENQPQLDSIPGERQRHFPYTWGVSGLHYVALLW